MDGGRQRKLHAESLTTLMRARTSHLVTCAAHNRRTGNRYNISRSMQRALFILKGLLPVVAIAATAVIVHAQSNNAVPAADQPMTTFHGATNEVIVPVTATDSQGPLHLRPCPERLPYFRRRPRTKDRLLQPRAIAAGRHRLPGRHEQSDEGGLGPLQGIHDGADAESAAGR